MTQERWYKDARAAWMAEEKANAIVAAEASLILDDLKVELDAITDANGKVMIKQASFVV